MASAAGGAGGHAPETTIASVQKAIERAAPGVEAVAQLELDDKKSVAALTALAAKLKRDRDGYVIEVDFRGTSIGNDALQHLSGLRRVRVVLLSETAITDVGAIQLGKISTLRNVDLRNCPISNAGIAPLSEIAELRALRLSGKNGNTTVDDDALGDIAKMTKLKVLAMDQLWVGSEGLSQLTELTELEELYLSKTLVDDESLALLAQFPKLKKRRRKFCTFPVEVLGIWLKTTTRGVLKCAKFSRQKAITSSALRLASGFSSIKAQGVSPQVSSGFATTATPATARWL